MIREVGVGIILAASVVPDELTAVALLVTGITAYATGLVVTRSAYKEKCDALRDKCDECKHWQELFLAEREQQHKMIESLKELFALVKHTQEWIEIRFRSRERRP